MAEVCRYCGSDAALDAWGAPANGRPGGQRTLSPELKPQIPRLRVFVEGVVIEGELEN